MKTPKKGKRPQGHCYADTGAEKARVIARINRIEGQLRGVKKMVEQEKQCMDVLRQISSISGAVRGLWTQVLGDHLSGCIAGAVQRHEKPLVDELVEFLQKTK